MTSSREYLLRYSRNVLLEGIGRDGQARLAGASVLVVGAGGLGSPALYYLAGAGIGRIGIIDGDRVEPSNLNRQILHSPDRVGDWKSASAAATLSAFNPDLKIETYPELLTADNALRLFRSYAAVIDGSDNFPAKYLCNDAAVVTGTPLVHAGVLRFGGQLMTVIPGKGPCLRCLLPELPPVADSPGSAKAGILGAAAGIFGAWQALEVVKLLTGAGEPLCGRLMALDGLTGSATVIPVSRDPECPACGESPCIREPLSKPHYIQEGNSTE
ncbi:MAG TPA: HesA/MoeB/ThiF family protein [Candidatus Deferrimicrobiaceae bacterium]